MDKKGACKNKVLYLCKIAVYAKGSPLTHLFTVFALLTTYNVPYPKPEQ